MDEETFNLSIRRFLKTVGISSQREIEHAVAAALGAASITGTESFPARMTLEIDGLKLKVVFDGAIDLGGAQEQRTPCAATRPPLFAARVR